MGAPQLIEAERRAIDAERKEMRRKQRRDENRVDDQAYRPCALRHGKITGDGPERDAEAELEIHKTPGERQAVEEHQRRKAGDLDAPLHHTFEHERAADDQQLAQEQKQPGGIFDAEEPRQLRDQQIHREIRIERPPHLVIRVGVGRAVLAQNIHAGEVIGIIDHRRNRRQQHGQKRGGGQQRENNNRH